MLREREPVRNEATPHQAFATFTDARKVAAQLDAPPPAETASFRCGVGHGGKSNRREAFAAHAAAVGQRGLAAFAGIAIQEAVLTFATDL